LLYSYESASASRARAGVGARAGAQFTSFVPLKLGQGRAGEGARAGAQFTSFRGTRVLNLLALLVKMCSVYTCFIRTRALRQPAGVHRCSGLLALLVQKYKCTDTYGAGAPAGESSSGQQTAQFTCFTCFTSTKVQMC
jgi:hypothetical protein